MREAGIDKLYLSKYSYNQIQICVILMLSYINVDMFTIEV